MEGIGLDAKRIDHVETNDGRIVTRRGAKEFSKWNKFNALKQRYDQSHSSRMVQLLRKQQRQREPEEFAQREAQLAQL